MNDASIEQEIQAKGLTAPRVTPADIEANIASVHYFTAADGAALKALQDMPENEDPDATYEIKVPPELALLTFCVLVLRNGFTVTGESACASPKNFDAEVGQKVAYQNAISKVWPLMGYALKEQLFQAQQPAQAPIESALPPHQQRVLDEKIELDIKLSNLLVFFGAETFKSLPSQDQHLLQQQAVSMEHYSEILGYRIEGFGIGGAA